MKKSSQAIARIAALEIEIATIKEAIEELRARQGPPLVPDYSHWRDMLRVPKEKRHEER